jgi:uncharacterized membrane protein YecN with MAPEG domain
MMRIAGVCAGLLGLLVFALGLGVSAARGRSNTVIGHGTDPADPLHKLVRAHGNAAEYAPMLAVLILYLGAHDPARWLVWTFVAATVSRYLHALGMITCARLDRPNPFRFVGALGTYVTGVALAIAMVV